MIDVKRIRDDFPLLRQAVHGHALAYLDNAATTHKPSCVLNRVQQFYARENSNVHRGVHYLSEQASAAYEAARERVRGFINAGSVAEIVFTRGATESLNAVAHSFGELSVTSDDEIIITEMEHHSNIVPWQIMCARRGAHLKILPFADDGRLRVDELAELISPRTKLVTAAHVSNVLGVVNPVQEIIACAHEHDVPVLIDGAQAAQHMPVDVQELGCDFYVFSGHKMYAENGIGVLYGKRKWLERMPPYQSGGGMVAEVNLAAATFAELPLKFEAGTPNVAAAASMDVAIDYLEQTGFDAIEAHERATMDYAIERLRGIEGIEIYASPANRCGALSFNLNGISDYDVGVILDKMGIAVRTGNHCAAPVMQHYGVGGMIRASFAMYNTHEDIDRLVEGIKRVKRMMG